MGAVVQLQRWWSSPVRVMVLVLITPSAMLSGCSLIGYGIGNQFDSSNDRETTLAAAVASGEPVEVRMVDGVRRGIIPWTHGDTLLLVSGVGPDVETTFRSDAREDTLLATDVLGIARSGQGSRSGLIGFLTGAAIDIYVVIMTMEELRNLVPGG